MKNSAKSKNVQSIPLGLMNFDGAWKEIQTETDTYLRTCKNTRRKDAIVDALNAVYAMVNEYAGGNAKKKESMMQAVYQYIAEATE